MNTQDIKCMLGLHKWTYEHPFGSPTEFIRQTCSICDKQQIINRDSLSLNKYLDILRSSESVYVTMSSPPSTQGFQLGPPGVPCPHCKGSGRKPEEPAEPASPEEIPMVKPEVSNPISGLQINE